MKEKFIAALYAQGLDESIVDGISEAIFDKRHYEFMPKEFQENTIKSLLEQIQEAISETLNTQI